ncbi:restriction endonuclease subunit S [Legionella spiritensis]|uniref:Putative type I restriction-modification system (Methylase S subunit) n=1 Tax=Legionella spiritensis TaxID=452 RepID=A0A0W0Z8X9_LEGSP|nr:restriction endonuclease subunit S [Legionella spiritensis]KTD65379.1 putative type I restriction-modification system (methylase S subunit) [Legionella spiritensis]SNV47169.1 type I restriction-modification system (methylase_S) [Legionella spiritensis]
MIQGYQRLKDTNINWLGKIPENWQLKPLKYIATYNDDSLSEDTRPDKIINYVDISSVNLSYGIEKIESYEFDQAPSRARRIVKDGDTILSTVRTYLKAISLIKEPIESLIVSTGFIVIRPSRTVIAAFLNYFIQGEGFIGEIVSKSVGVSYPAIGPSGVMKIEIAIPALKEQKEISLFLDKKTSEIDALIAKKEKLIKLLEEKRTALITQAVTKGLDPNVPMKDSGVEWMGDIPEHWQIIPFKHVIYFQEGPGIMAVDFVDQGVPLLRIRNLTSNKVQLEGCNYLNPEKVEKVWKQFKLDIGDLLISTSATTGLVSSVGYEAVGSIPYTGIIRLKPKNKSISNEYIKLIVSSSLFFTQIDLLKTGSTIQHFGPLHLNQMFICLPPSNEQGEIVIFLNSRTKKIDEIKSKILEAIERLKEYRSALITNAVTGKIKVSNINVDLPEPEKLKHSSGGHL